MDSVSAHYAQSPAALHTGNGGIIAPRVRSAMTLGYAPHKLEVDVGAQGGMIVMQFRLIMVFVDEDRTDAVLEAARGAAATGATIISNARGRGLKPQPTFFGFEFLAARSVILVLAEQSRAAAIMQAVALAGELDESENTGIAIELEVSNVLGLKEHMRHLAALK